MADFEIKWDPASERETLRLLKQIKEEARGPAITASLRAAGNVVKKTLRDVLPKPGYPGDKPGLAPLRDNVLARVRSYEGGDIKVMVVGYSWPGGAHGQPLEHGHEKFLWGEKIEGSPVQAYPYLEESVKLNRQTLNQTLINGARRALERAKKRGLA